MNTGRSAHFLEFNGKLKRRLKKYIARYLCRLNEIEFVGARVLLIFRRIFQRVLVKNRDWADDSGPS